MCFVDSLFIVKNFKKDYDFICVVFQHIQDEIDYDYLILNLKRWFKYPMVLKSLKLTQYSIINRFYQ